MAIRNKYSRVIIVDGETYRWRIPPQPNYDQGHMGEMSVIVWRVGAPSCILHLIGGPRPDNLQGLHGEIVTPRRVAAAIRAAIASGWKPTKAGPAFVIDLPAAPEGPEAR
jgi:hypothetical protein